MVQLARCCTSKVKIKETYEDPPMYSKSLSSDGVPNWAVGDASRMRGCLHGAMHVVRRPMSRAFRERSI